MLGRINLLTFFLLIYLVKSNPNNLLPTKTRPAKKTKPIKKAIDVVGDKNRVAIMICL